MLNKILTHHKSPLNISETYFFVICRFVVILLGINREIMVSGRLESNRPDTPAEKRLNLKSVGTTAIFRLEARCDDPAGDRMNLHLSLASSDSEERQIAVEHTDASPIRKETTYSVQTSDPAASVAASVNAVLTADPPSDIVADTPPFKLSFRILRGQEVIDAQQIQVNRWGGTQRIGMIYK